MDGRLFLIGENAGAFHHHIDTHIAPGQLVRIALGEHFEGAMADIHHVAINFYVSIEAPVHRIIFKQMRVRRDRTEVVDGDQLQIPAVVLDHGAQDVAPDAPETVDCDLDCHVNTSAFVVPILCDWRVSAVS